MIRAKCDWVYQIPCFKIAPRRAQRAAPLEAFTSSLARISTKKDSGSAR